jgi:hypothetical protein
MLRRLSLSLTLIIASIIIALAQPATESTRQTTIEPNQHSSEKLRVSVITCYPGEEVYELYGHSAIRIMSERFDSVWNYGMFDFREPNFVGRFVKGDLQYAVGGYPFAWFLPEYQATNRHVVEQELNLTDQEATNLRKALQINALPQNRKYPYDYVHNNCATRIWDKVHDNLTSPVTYPQKSSYPTFRSAMRAYHSHYPWYSLGIDVALGYPIDTLINGDDELFLPEKLMQRLANTTRSDGMPLVRNTVVLNQGAEDATLPPTPWWQGPCFWAWIVAVVAVIYAALSQRYRRCFRIFEAIYFFIIGLAGLVVAYLVLISSHAAASPNLLLAWLNPLAWIVPICIWSAKTRMLAVAYLAANVIAIIFVSIVWPFQEQCGNAAFIPLLVADAALAANYVALYIKSRTNYYRL